MSRVVDCQDCGAPVRLVLVIPAHIDPTRPRRHIPLDLDYDPTTHPTPPSHGLNLARTACHPITDQWPLEDHEVPALTHFATCPARHRAPVPEGTTR